MAYARYESVAVNTAGDVIPNATIEVREDRAGRPVVPLWANREGTEPLGNPIKSDELGKFGFYAKGGSYYIRVFTGPSQQPFQQYVRRHQAIGTAAERDVEDLATALQTGTATFPTLSALEAFAPSAVSVGGKVTTGPDAGFYHYDDLSSAWVFDRPLFDTLARMIVTGGTADAIEAEIETGVADSAVVMLWIEAPSNNTGPVTINGKPVLTIDEAPLLAGQWLSGRTYWFSDEGSFYKLRTESDVSGLVAQAEAAATSAQDAAGAAAGAAGAASGSAAEAAGYAAGLNLPGIGEGDAGKQLYVTEEETGYELRAPSSPGVGTRVSLKSLDTSRHSTAYLTEPGREGQFIWRAGDYSARIASDTFEGIYVKANAVASTEGAWVRAFDGPVMADWFGAKPDTSVDNTPRIASALTLAKHVIVPSQGDYRLDGMLQLTGEKTIELRGGVYLRRFAAHSASTEPLVWIRGNGDAFFGVGQRSCGLRTENRHPSGMLRLGQESMSVGTDIVTYANVHDFQLIGMQPHGQTTGQPDVCVYMPSPEFNSNANYLHTIRNLSLERANAGLWMQGWANGNIITGLYGYQIGNQSMPTRAAMIICEGGLDNIIANSFFMEGPDSTMLVVSTFDNTANGGYVHVPIYNSFTGLASEQGGAASKGLEVHSGSANHYEIRSNAGGGNQLYDGFYRGNTLIAPDNNRGGLAIGGGYQKSYDGIGTRTITLYFRTALTGAAYRGGVLKVLFTSTSGDAAYADQVSEINIPFKGISTWGLGAAVQTLSGAAPTVTLVSGTASTLVLTVAPEQTSQEVSLFATAVQAGGVVLE